MQTDGEVFQAIISDLEGNAVLLPGNLRARMLSWRDIGGCERAELVLENAPGGYWQGSELIGKSVRVYNRSGSLVWWGYVQSAARNDGEYRLSRSLADLANRVSVRYSELQPQGESFGLKKQTEWALDARSAAHYGQKDLLLERGLMAESAALQLRDQTLARLAEPAARLSLGTTAKDGPEKRKEGTGSQIRLECLGWYARLAWRVYQPPTGLLGNASAQQGSQGLGNTSSFQRIAQSFTTDSGAARPAQVQVRVRRYGSPNDSLRAALQADNGSGSPSGLHLASATISGAALAAEAYPWTAFSFALPPQLLANSSYWLVLSRTGAVSAANYYLLAVDEKLSYPAGTFKTYNGSAWAARSVPADLVFTLSAFWESTDLILEAAGLLLHDPFKRVSVESESGVYLTPASESPQPADRFVQALLELGTERFTALTCTVEPDLGLVFAERPPAQEAETWRLGPGTGLQKPGGLPCLPGELPVGKWLRCAENPAVYVTGGQISAPDWTPRLESA